MKITLQHLTLAIVAASLLAPGLRAQVDGETVFETLKVSIKKQRTIASVSSPFGVAKAQVKADLLRTGSRVPDSYVEELFDGRYQMLYPDVQEKYAERERQKFEKAELKQEPAPDSYGRYRKIFITEENFTDGAAFIRTHRALLDSVQARYCVDAALLVALVASETWYGDEVGSYRVFDSLLTIIMLVPGPKWLAWAAHEEAEFIKMAYDQKMSASAAHAVIGTYDGGMGYVQFEPSSLNAYAVDFDGDGKIRLNEWPDALGSAANYLALKGYDAKAEFSMESAIGKSLYAYNHSDNYVRGILELREELLRRQSKKKAAGIAAK